jgi:hypothetical protein
VKIGHRPLQLENWPSVFLRIFQIESFELVGFFEAI